MELRGFLRNAVLTVLKEKAKATGTRLPDDDELLESLSEIDRAKAVRTAFSNGIAAKLMVLDAVDEQGFMPFPKFHGTDLLELAVRDFDRAINIIIAERGDVCSKTVAVIAIQQAFNIASRLVPPDDISRELQDSALKELAQRAGKNSAKTRAGKAAETWEPNALRLALASRKVDKGWSQDDVAHYVFQHWGKEKNKPSHRTLKARISNWIKTGKLPDKVRQ